MAIFLEVEPPQEVQPLGFLSALGKLSEKLPKAMVSLESKKTTANGMASVLLEVVEV